MIGAPTLTQITATPAVLIRLPIPRAQINAVMGPARAEVLAAVEAQGLAPTGPLFSYHYRTSADLFDVAVGVPFASAVMARGRMEAGEVPAARVAQTIYHGPYEGLAEAWSAFETWIKESGDTRRADLWERDVAGPASGAAPSEWQTARSQPLADTD